MSSILRRTYAVLDFALNKWEWMQNRTTPVDGGPRKRGKTNPEVNQQLPDLANFNQNQSDNQSTVNPPEESSFEGLTNGEHTSEESRHQDNLFRIFLQDHLWADYVDFNHDPVRLPNVHLLPK
jgi:hypothetical protein